MKGKAGIYVLAGVLAAGTLSGCSSSVSESDTAITVGDTRITGDVANFMPDTPRHSMRPIMQDIWEMICGTPRQRKDSPTRSL